MYTHPLVLYIVSPNEVNLLTKGTEEKTFENRRYNKVGQYDIIRYPSNIQHTSATTYTCDINQL